MDRILSGAQRAAALGLVVLGALMVSPAPALANGPASVAPLAAVLQDTVVNISTTRMIPGGRGLPYPDVPPGSPLEEFFSERNPNQGLGEERMREARSLGSGFIISADGLIVTNNHVIEGAAEIVVFLSDGTRLAAEILGMDEKTDLAVLKVDAGRELSFAEIGDSEAAEVGDWVLAIGNPFGLGGSVTIGIISARNRDINVGPYDNFIQTDAAINQGNSGGPLFDMDGRVVGINTAILSRTGGSLGIGFAIPVDLAQPVIMQLAEFGETRRGWLGVGIQDVSDMLAEALERPNTQGALVVDVTRGGPGDGVLLDGDLILEFDSRPIVRMRDLPRFVAESEVGRSVDVLVLRDGRETTLTITLGQLELGEQLMAQNRIEDSRGPAARPDPVDVETGPLDLSGVLGVTVEALSAESRAEFEVGGRINGVLVREVAPDSEAGRKGVVPGMVIEEVNGQRISSLNDVETIVSTARDMRRNSLLLLLADPDGARRYVAVPLG